MRRNVFAFFGGCFLFGFVSVGLDVLSILEGPKITHSEMDGVVFCIRRLGIALSRMKLWCPS